MIKWLGVGAVIAIAIAALAVPAVRHLRETAPPPDPPLRLALAAPPGTELGSGEDILDAAISPDQRQIVFVATNDGTARLWRRSLDAESATAIPGTDGAALPAWKQTGNVVSFFAGDRVKQVSLQDGTIRDLAGASSPAGASWLPDGSLLLAPGPNGPIRRVSNSGVSDATRLRAGDRTHSFPMVVASTDAFVYTATRDDGRRVVRLISGGQERELATTTGHGQLIGDTLLHVRDNVLLSQRLDPETRNSVGRATAVVLNVGTTASGHGLYAASPRLLISAPSIARLRQLVWLTTSGGRTSLRDPGDYWQVRLSPDDRYAAVTATAPLIRTLDVLLVPTSDEGNVEPLTRALAADSDPVWSPDASRIAFRSLQDGPPRLFTHGIHDADVKDDALPGSDLDETPTDWESSRLLFHARNADSGFDIWTLSLPAGRREKVINTGFNETDARLSPDGRWIAYVSDESGRPDIYASRWPRGARVRVSFAGGTRPRWSRDGTSLFFLRGSEIMQATLTPESTFGTARAVVTAPGIRDFDVAHRSERFIALVPASASASPAVSALVDWMSAASPER